MIKGADSETCQSTGEAIFPRRRPVKVRLVDMSISRDNFLGGILRNTEPLDKEILNPRRPITVTALNTKTHGEKFYIEGHKASFGSCLELVQEFRSALEAQPETDFIMAGEHSLYFHPQLALSLIFEEKNAKFEVKSGQPEVVAVIQVLQDLAREFNTNICIGTVCEQESIEGITVHHNTAVTIDHNGEIVQLRRKFTGSESLRILDDGYSTDFLYGKKHYHGLVPGIDIQPESLQQEIVAKAYLSALSTVKPINLKTKQDENFSVIINICAERSQDNFLVQASSFEADVMALLVNEGDDAYTQRSREILSSQGKAFLETDLSHTRTITPQWEGSYFAEAAVAKGVLSSRGVWVAADTAGDSGVFSVYDTTSVAQATFAQGYVVAKCLV